MPARGRRCGLPGRVAEPLLGKGEGAFVFGADGGVEQPAVAQAHLGRDVFYMRVIQRQ